MTTQSYTEFNNRLDEKRDKVEAIRAKSPENLRARMMSKKKIEDIMGV